LRVVTNFVIPAKAGIHLGLLDLPNVQMDSGVRRND
jgi:hypothetical protein